MKTAYEEILAVMEKHSSVLTGDYSTDIRNRLRLLIRWERVQAVFGITIPPSSIDGDWVNISYNQKLGFFGKEHDRTIGCPDDGRQPSSEWLYLVTFPTGAYTFGDGYFTKTFNAMIEEIKTYRPKYSDSRNSNFYFDYTAAAAIHKDLKGIIEKYTNEVGTELKEQEIAKLKKKLAELEGEEK